MTARSVQAGLWSLPESIPLYFFDQGSTSNVPLTSSTTSDELAQPFPVEQ